MILTAKNTRRDTLLTLAFLILSVALYFLPTGFEANQPANAVRCKAEVLALDNSEVQAMGFIRVGSQDVTLRILDGEFKGKVVDGFNQLQGRMDLDKVYEVGDLVLLVLSLDENGKIVYVNPQDHYRLGHQGLMLGMFALLLVLFGGMTGLRALLSFCFAALMIWKILVPCLLRGYDPILLSLGVVALLTSAIIFLVAGFNLKGLVAFAGAFLGILTSSVLSLYFSYELNLHGAVMPFAETLLYSGYGHLDLVRLYAAAVFLAASGAVMDLAMDVSASLWEIFEKKPDISRREALASGLNVSRAVVGTMTTTLLLAYSGGYITLMMAFMAQGVPLANFFNLLFVAAEVMKTLVGSFGLVAVAPFTTVVGVMLFATGTRRGKVGQITDPQPEG